MVDCWRLVVWAGRRKRIVLDEREDILVAVCWVKSRAMLLCWLMSANAMDVNVIEMVSNSSRSLS